MDGRKSLGVKGRGLEDSGTEGRWARFNSSVWSLSEKRWEREVSSLPSLRHTAFNFSDPTLQFSG